jgi:hypothetical protein
MLKAKIPRSIIFSILRSCVVAKLNWGAFIDEDDKDG